jgi:hypothetical protein
MPLAQEDVIFVLTSEKCRKVTFGLHATFDSMYYSDFGRASSFANCSEGAESESLTMFE